MLKTAFIGSNNDFDQVLVHWLSRHSNLVGVVWTQSSAWKRTLRGKVEFIKKRLRRRGLLATMNEALFYIYYHSTQNRRVSEQFRRNVLEPYWNVHGRPRWTGDSIFSLNVNTPAVHEFLLQRQPDVAFAICIHNYFGRTLREIPDHGILLWHEGITPEYKGLYSPFWAMHNLDFNRLGYTLLQMNDEYDAGDIFCQGNVTDIDPMHDSHDYIGHKAIVDSLPQVKRLLLKLEDDSARPIVRTDACAAYYTYPGITDLIRQRLRLRRFQHKNTALNVKPHRYNQ